MRFSDYDIFAYLASGFTALAGWDLLFSTRYVIGAQWSVSSGAITIVAAYVIGQIFASPAAWLIERQFVRRFLGRPSDLLIRITEVTLCAQSPSLLTHKNWPSPSQTTSSSSTSSVQSGVIKSRSVTNFLKTPQLLA